MYTNAKAIVNLSCKRKEVVETETKSQLPPFDEWQSWNGEFLPGYFTTDDLMVVRREFLQSGRNPKVSLRNLGEYSQVSYRCSRKMDGERGTCVVRERPSDCQEIIEWLSKLPRQIEYHGERLAAITLRVFLELLKSERIYLDSSQKEALLIKQDHRCNSCGGIFDGDVEWDHTAALRQSLRGQEQNFQAICSSCHAEKTALESRQDGGITSFFNKRPGTNTFRVRVCPPRSSRSTRSPRIKRSLGSTA